MRFAAAACIAAGLTAGLAGTSQASPQYTGYRSPEDCQRGIDKYRSELGYQVPTCVYNSKMGYWQITG